MKRRALLVLIVMGLLAPLGGWGSAFADDRVRVIGVVDDVAVNGSTVTFQGWAMNPSYSYNPIQLHVYDQGPSGTVGYAGFRTTESRPDVAAAYGKPDFPFGFSITVPLNPGLHRFCVYGIDFEPRWSSPAIGCTSVTGPATFGVIDTGSPAWVIQVPSGRPLLALDGWAIDPGRPTTPLPIHVYDRSPNGSVVGTPLMAGAARPDVAAAFPGSGADQGFSLSVGLTPDVGQHQVCVYAISVSGLTNGRLGCRRVQVYPSVVGAVDVVAPLRAGRVFIAGWSADPADPSSTLVNTTQGLGDHSEAIGDVPRSDVAAVFPALGANHGFRTSALMTPGTRDVCMAAVTPFSSAGAVVGCRSVTMRNAMGAIDAVTVSGGTITVTGWLVDPYEPGQTSSLALEAVRSDGQRFSADQFGDYSTVERSDVNAALGVTGVHGFTKTWGMALPPGQYSIQLSSSTVYQAAALIQSGPSYPAATASVTVG